MDNSFLENRSFERRQLSRRQFLASSAAIGLAAPLSTVLLAKTGFAETPSRGGRLRMGVADSSTNENLDPATFVTAMSYVVSAGALRNSLVELDENALPVPELAESWEPSADATTWVFKLRKGVEFHNGKTLTAEDVVYSLNRHRGKDSKSQAKALMADVTNIQTDGPDTVVFSLSGGSADFPYIVSDARTQISPAGDEDFDQGTGTGGYILQDYEPGVRAFVKRNPNYWKKNRAHFDEVEFLGINDTSARTNALRSGEVDVMNRCHQQTYSRLVDTQGIQGIETEGPAHYTIPMRTDIAPFDNNDVRLALKYGLDREALLRAVLSGHGSIGNDHPISKIVPYFAAGLPQRTYDPERSKYLLKQAGFAELTVPLFTSDGAFSGAVDAAILYKEHAAKAGITIDVTNMPADGYWSNVWMKEPWCFSYWFGRVTADWVFSLTYAAESSQNETFWTHEKFNKLLKEARAELNEAKRSELYYEMQQICSDEGGAVIPLFNNDLMAARDSLRFGRVAGNAQMDGLKLPERWWFSSS